MTTEKIIGESRKLLTAFGKMPQLTQLIVACMLVAVSFNLGQCNGDSKLNKFRAEFATLQKEAKVTKQFADSAKSQVTQLTLEAHSKDSVITRLSLSVELGNKKRDVLKGTLNKLEDSLKVTTDTAQIIGIQEGIIDN